LKILLDLFANGSKVRADYADWKPIHLSHGISVQPAAGLFSCHTQRSRQPLSRSSLRERVRWKLFPRTCRRQCPREVETECRVLVIMIHWHTGIHWHCWQNPVMWMPRAWYTNYMTVKSQSLGSLGVPLFLERRMCRSPATRHSNLGPLPNCHPM
jgi:hypothetical protein